MAQGTPIQSVDNMPMSDFANVWIAYQRGLAGPYKDYIIAYNLNPPRNKNKKIIPFDKIFPDVDSCLRLKGNVRKQTEEEKAMAMADYLGMPDNIRQKLMGG